MTVILTCVEIKNKKRVRFHSFIDDETGKEYFDAYNKTYNCRFPRSMRQVGKFYCVPDRAITLIQSGSRKPCYSVCASDVEYYDNEQKKVKRQVFLVKECVVCLEEKDNVTFLPCGHKCTCKDCYGQLCNNKCPLCRTKINKTI